MNTFYFKECDLEKYMINNKSDFLDLFLIDLDKKTSEQINSISNTNYIYNILVMSIYYNKTQFYNNIKNLLKAKMVLLDKSILYSRYFQYITKFNIDNSNIHKLSLDKVYSYNL